MTEPEVAAIGIENLRGDSSRRRREEFIRRIFQATAVVSIVITGLIILSLLGGAVDFLRSADLTNLWASGWFPRRGLFDVRTIITATFIVAIVAMLVATPLGLGAGIYLSEYAHPRARKVIKPILEILAGIPSVVLGFFALTWINPHLVQSLWSEASPFTMMAAGIGVGILVTPLVASISEDAMRAVPLSLREASYGLGARRRSTTLKVVVPAAVSGIVASLIVGISRAIGETMVVAIAAGGSGGAPFTTNPLEPGQTMTGAMAALAIGSDQVQGNQAAVKSLFFVGMLLFLMTLALNILSERFVRRVRQKY